MQFYASAVAEIPSDSVNLHAYPGLTYAPTQHGPGVRFAHNGKPVQDVISILEAKGLAADLDSAAKTLGVSFGDICDALKFLRDNEAI